MGTAIAELSNLSPPSEDGAIGRALAELDSKLEAWSNAMSTAHRSMSECEFDSASCDDSAVVPSIASNPAPERVSNASEDTTVSIVDNPIDTPTEAPKPSKKRRKKKTKSEKSTDVVADAEPSPGAVADPSARSLQDADQLIDRLTDAMSRSDHLERYGESDRTENAIGNEPTDATQSTDEDVETVLASVDAQVAEQLRARHAATGGEKTLRQVCDEYFAEIADAERLLSTLEPEMAQTIRVQYRLFNGRKSIHQLVKNYEPPKENAKKKSWWRG